ncbi:hypothetical protein [Asticcacaulis sp. 201]|uniref:hypothetical protein n=1 Tax=Asticcacaulis sp. 201 TaxID=3028787 RepID=UPI0029167F31|nr:hypothetical protein [Asticcacaulis sp. 201]MDV6331298.1 hypothetical protein [Asticcacaulis sp. 201]
MKKTVATLLLLALGMTFAGNAMAETYTGRLASYFLSGPSNLPFRVYLDTSTPNCPGNLFYVDINNANYQAYVSGLLTAFSMQKSVIITYTVGTGGYCAISEYQVLA